MLPFWHSFSYMSGHWWYRSTCSGTPICGARRPPGSTCGCVVDSSEKGKGLGTLKAFGRCGSWVWEHHGWEKKILGVRHMEFRCVCWSCFSACSHFIWCFLVCLDFSCNLFRQGFIQSFWEGQAGSVGPQYDKSLGNTVLPKNCYM